MNAYDFGKAAWHLDRLQQLKHDQRVEPVHVQLIISDLCNQNCHFCAYRMDGGFSTQNFGEDTGKGFTMNPNRMIPKEKAFEILDDAHSIGVKAVQFTGGEIGRAHV